MGQFYDISLLYYRFYLEFSCNNYILIDIDITKCCDNPSSIFTNRFNKCICFIHNRCGCVNICCFFLSFLFCCSIIFFFSTGSSVSVVSCVASVGSSSVASSLPPPQAVNVPMQLKRFLNSYFFLPATHILILFCIYIVVIGTFFKKKDTTP